MDQHPATFTSRGEYYYPTTLPGLLGEVEEIMYGAMVNG